MAQEFPSDNNQTNPFSDPYEAPTTDVSDVLDEAVDKVDEAVTSEVVFPATEPTQEMPAARSASQPDYWDANAAAAGVAAAAASPQSQPAYAQPTMEFNQPTAQAAYDQAYAQASYAQGQAQQGYATAPGAPYAQPAASYTGTGTPSLVLGILSILLALSGVFAPIGLVLGIIAIVKGKKSLTRDVTDGRAKAGRVTGIIGTIFSVLATLSLIALIGLGIAAYNSPEFQEVLESPEFQEALEGELGQDLGTFDGGTDTGAAGSGAAAGALGANTDSAKVPPAAGMEPSTNTGEEDTVRAIVKENVDKMLVFGDEERKALADTIAQGLETETGFPLDTLGDISPEKYVDWVLQDVTYEIGAVRVNGNKASAEVLVNIHDLDALSDNIEHKIEAWMATEEYGSIDSIDALYKKMGTILTEAMNETGFHTEDVELLLVKDNGTWKLDSAAQAKLYSELLTSDAY